MSGLNKAEMDAWWARKGRIDLGPYSRQAVEGPTGRLPLLLDECTVGGKLDLECPQMARVVHECRTFVVKMRVKLSERECEL